MCLTFLKAVTSVTVNVRWLVSIFCDKMFVSHPQTCVPPGWLRMTRKRKNACVHNRKRFHRKIFTLKKRNNVSNFSSVYGVETETVIKGIIKQGVAQKHHHYSEEWAVTPLLSRAMKCTNMTLVVRCGQLVNLMIDDISIASDMDPCITSGVNASAVRSEIARRHLIIAMTCNMIYLNVVMNRWYIQSITGTAYFVVSQHTDVLDLATLTVRSCYMLRYSSLLSRCSRQRERLSASVLSICSFVCLSVCRQNAKKRYFLKK